jgi:hypothetical protein
MSHILVDAETFQPVPLPFHCRDTDGDTCTITDARMARGVDPMLYLSYGPGYEYLDSWYHIDLVKGMQLVTEEEFQRTRADLDKEEEA